MYFAWFRAQRRELHAELVEVQTRHVLVEVLRQHVHLLLVVRGAREEFDLRDHLVAEARRHDERPLVLHLTHVVNGENARVARRGDEDVGGLGR